MLGNFGEGLQRGGGNRVWARIIRYSLLRLSGVGVGASSLKYATRLVHCKMTKSTCILCTCYFTDSDQRYG